MGRKFVTGLVTGMITAGVAGGIIAGVPALADNSSSPSPRATSQDGGPRGGEHGPGGGPFGALHGEFTAKDQDGKYVLRDVQRGQVTAVSDRSLTVKSEDGTSWTWTVDSGTKVGRDGKISSIKTGDTVHVQGTRNGDTRIAAFIAEPPPGGAGRPPGAEGPHRERGDKSG